MFMLVALVVLSIAPDKPLKLTGMRYPTEQQCEEIAQRAPEALQRAYKQLGLDAEVRVGCVLTDQHDI